MPETTETPGYIHMATDQIVSQLFSYLIATPPLEERQRKRRDRLIGELLRRAYDAPPPQSPANPGNGHEKSLEDVLDSYRLAGRLCGVQVLAVDKVICWVGDIREPMTLPEWWGWEPPSAPPMLYKATGANAVEDAAKWLRSQLEKPAPAPPPTYSLEEIRRAAGLE